MKNCIQMMKKQIPGKSTVAMYYLGQESFVFSTPDCTIGIDLYLSDFVDQKCCSKAVKWVRSYPAPVTAEELAPMLHYVFCTHAHSDHTDPWTIPVLAQSNEKLIFFASRAFSDKLVDMGVPADRVVPVDAGKVYRYPGFSFVGIPAAHEELHLTEKGYAELSFRFSFTTEPYGDTVFFHGGDCCMYDGLREAIGHADVMLLPVNGRDYYNLRDDVIGNLTAREAVILSEEVDADMLIPMHYDLYSNNGLPATDFVNAVLPSSLKYHLFRPGERMLYMKDAD
ncbi:MAG: MBL fold metallo-hydrolase [Clostridia bacterium]|nr:MBL fold metallo-hydrolase [Clostridia bacterium]